MNHPTELICRKDIARRLGMSVDFLRKNEDRLGFGKARVFLGKRTVRFRTIVVDEVISDLYRRSVRS